MPKVRTLNERTISRQSETIEKLKKQIRELEIDNKAKDDIIATIDNLREELIDIIDELKGKSKEYDSLLKEMVDVKSILADYVFKR